MKRNFLIIFLLAVIVFFTYKIFNSAVVTQRKVEPSQVSTEVIENPELNKIPPKADDNAKSSLNPEFRFTSDYNNTNSKKDFIQDKKEHFSEQSFEFEKQKADNIYSKSNKKTLLKEKSIPEFGQSPHKFPKIESGILMCTPYTEKLKTEYMGMNVEYTVEISGWINNRCILNFSMDILSPGSKFESTYGISDDMVEVFGFAPKVRCEFSKQQLLYVGDSILEEKQKDRKMLKNPEQIDFPDFRDLSFSDMKLLQVILNDRACKILNSDEILNMFENLF